MVKQIADILFYGPYESIRNWDCVKCKFHDAADTLRAHEIINITAQTKRAMDNELNNLLIGKGYNKRI